MRRRRKKNILQLILTILFFVAGTMNFRKLHKRLYSQQSWEYEEYQYQAQGLSERVQDIVKHQQQNEVKQNLLSADQEIRASRFQETVKRPKDTQKSLLIGNNSLSKYGKRAFIMQPLASMDDVTIMSQVQAELKRVYEFFTNTESTCSEVLFVGGRKIYNSFKERSFPICTDPKVWKPTQNKSQCLVYSYGIDNDWGFDDTMSLLYECEVHAFDANMYEEHHYHERNKNLIFHKVAIGDQNAEEIMLRGKRDYLIRKKFGEKELDRYRLVKMHTLSTVMKQLGHEKRILDIFRIDAEGPRISYELNVLKNILDEGTYRCIRQITFENHYFGPYLDGSDYLIDSVREAYSLLKSLQTVGFQFVSVTIPSHTNVGSLQDFIKTLNGKNSVVPIMLWVNLNPEPCW